MTMDEPETNPPEAAAGDNEQSYHTTTAASKIMRRGFSSRAGTTNYPTMGLPPKSIQ